MRKESFNMPQKISSKQHLYFILKRLFDISVSFVMLLALFPLLLLISIVIKLSDKGPSLYWSKRIGKNGKIFWMPKFRSMKLSTPQVATDKLSKPEDYMISIGSLIRKTSIDELPQLYSVLIGEMSLVGPRPALYNQYELIAAREQKGVNQLKPGITGWAQINGRDNISDTEKLMYDVEYVRSNSIKKDLFILMATVKKVIKRDAVSH